MAQPTTSIYLNSTTPAAPSGNQNVKPQSDGATPLQSVTFYPQQATSSLLGVVVPDNTTISVDGSGKLSVPAATATSIGLVKPDGTTITIDATGKITAAGGGGGGSTTVLFNAGPPTGSQPSVVQSHSVAGHSVAFSSAVTSGNLLLVAYSSESAITGVTISDTLDTTYTLVKSISGQARNMNVYAGVAGSSGANTVTISLAPNNFDQIGCMEVHGCTATVDVSASSYNSTSPYSLSITTTNTPDFIFAAVAAFHNAATFTFSGSFTLDSQSNGSDAQALGHYVPTAPGPSTLTVSVSTAADNQPAILVAFEGATGGLAGSEGDICFDTSNGYAQYVYHSGAWTSSTATSGIYDVACYQGGSFSASQTCMELNVVRSFTLPLNLSGSVAKLDAAPTASATFTILRNGTSAGSINFAAGSRTGTFTFSSPMTFIAGDTLSITAPATSDVSAAGLSVTLAGSR